MAEYDRAEAEAILGRKHGLSEELAKVRANSASILLDNVRSLSGGGETGLSATFSKESPHLWISFGDKAAHLGWVDDQLQIMPLPGDNREPHAIPLLFEPHWRRFEGTTPDTFRAPVPGEPHRMRSALAVVVEACLTFLAGTPSPRR